MVTTFVLSAGASFGAVQVCAAAWFVFVDDEAACARRNIPATQEQP
jgi:hypothetical protein